jgi:hypothetical protein
MENVEERMKKGNSRRKAAGRKRRTGAVYYP